MTRDEMMRIALRYDTVMSHALLRALGVEIPHRIRAGTIARMDKYDGIAECMGQRYGVSL